MQKQLHFLNGKFVPEEELVVSVRDLGFMRGYAVFDFLRTYNRRPFQLHRNINRLFNSANAIGLKIPWTKEQVTQWVLDTIEKNKSDTREKTIKIILSGGISPHMLPSGAPTIVIVTDPRIPYPQDYYDKGVAVIAVKFTRYAPEAKSNNYIEGVKQSQIADTQGAIEPLYYDENQVFEGSNSNVFAVIDNKLLTPKSNILGGITRQVLLEILKLDIPIEVKDFTLEQLFSAQEAFFTSSSRGITSIVRVGDKKIGDGKVGPVAKEVMRQFAEYTMSDKW